MIILKQEGAEPSGALKTYGEVLDLARKEKAAFHRLQSKPILVIKCA